MTRYCLLVSGFQLCLTFFAFGQNIEAELPPSAFSATYSPLQTWEDFFEENYFNLGIPFDSVCREGTGYLPYYYLNTFY